MSALWEVTEDWEPANARPHRRSSEGPSTAGWHDAEVDAEIAARRRSFVAVDSAVLERVAAALESFENPVTRGDDEYFQRLEVVAKELEDSGVRYDPARFARFVAALDEAAANRR